MIKLPSLHIRGDERTKMQSHMTIYIVRICRGRGRYRLKDGRRWRLGGSGLRGRMHGWRPVGSVKEAVRGLCSAIARLRR
ncbi:hypothetical protein HN873_047536, partial [Arachis hypogaea]